MKKIIALFLMTILLVFNVFSQVGIGTTNPTAQLELTQSLKFPETTSNVTGIIFKGDYPFLHDYKGGAALGYNTFLGVDAGNFTSGGSSDFQGCNNTGIGFYSLHSVTTGYANTAIGAFALPSVTTGVENTAVGLQSLNANVGGSRNVALGYMASHENTSGSNNIAIGFNANYYNQTGSNNTILGHEAGRASALHNKTGNVFIGFQAGFSETGSNKLYIENTNTASPLIGGDFNLNEVYINGKLRIADGTQSAGRIFKSTADGTGSWADATTISDGDWTISGTHIYSAVSGNVGIGVTAPAQRLELDGSIRFPATTSSTTGVIYKGSEPFIHDYKGASALGYNTFIGQGAGNFTSGSLSNWQGCNNTGLGYYALHGVSTGYANTAAGAFALQLTTTGVENTAVGLQAMVSNVNGNKNTAVGYMAQMQNTSGSQNTAVGFNANYYNQTGSNNTIIGYEAGSGAVLHSKSGNVFIGHQAGYNETGSNKLYIDNSNTSAPLIGGDFSSNQVHVNGKLGIGTTAPLASALLDLTSTNSGLVIPRMTTAQRTAIGSPVDGLLVYDTDADAVYLYRNGVWSPELNGATGWALTGNGGTSSSTNFIGTTDNVILKFKVNNVQSGLIDPINMNTGIGYQGLNALTAGKYNVATGYQASYSNTTGYSNVAIGTKALYSNTIRGNLVAIGDSAMLNNGIGATDIWDGYRNTAVGSKALYTNKIGYCNTAVGFRAQCDTKYGNWNTAIGHMAMFATDTAWYNTYVGACNGMSGSKRINSSAFGYMADPTANNMVAIGNTSVTWIGGQVGWSTYSDGRVKRNVSNEIDGLDFILALRPVTYQYDIKKLDSLMGNVNPLNEMALLRQARADQEKIVYSGFIAQEVEQAAKKCGYDFSGVQAPVNEQTPYSLRYAEFVVPLVKAVQEQQGIISDLGMRISELQKQNEELVKRIEALEGK